MLMRIRKSNNDLVVGTNSKKPKVDDKLVDKY